MLLFYIIVGDPAYTIDAGGTTRIAYLTVTMSLTFLVIYLSTVTVA